MSIDLLLIQIFILFNNIHVKFSDKLRSYQLMRNNLQKCNHKNKYNYKTLKISDSHGQL